MKKILRTVGTAVAMVALAPFLPLFLFLVGFAILLIKCGEDMDAYFSE